MIINGIEFKPFDMAEELQTEEDIQVYINLVMEEDDPAELAHALGVIAKARGMTQIAKQAGIGRESLYKALREGANPRYGTIAKVLGALGLKLVAVPANNTHQESLS
ncbi:putative addiction module antidote protein [Pelistega sp. NLN82]|uniref:Putative addiction module antidote protein n=1 Tax=Pelistega ratti TaxID=2652177 RepID=A0A6L9Y5I2_9BURK|nr:addiction module antidote protein [Pelistega ratti]NEN75720.1 putative addiction module antidote protein [Pelistega ratti]